MMKHKVSERERSKHKKHKNKEKNQKLNIIQRDSLLSCGKGISSFSDKQQCNEQCSRMHETKGLKCNSILISFGFIVSLVVCLVLLL